jgi:hypothetical protein
VGMTVGCLGRSQERTGQMGEQVRWTKGKGQRQVDEVSMKGDANSNQ